jgi:hypothetical protein
VWYAGCIRHTVVPPDDGPEEVRKKHVEVINKIDEIH